MQCVYFKGENGEIVKRTDIPESLMLATQVARRELLESLSMLDDGIFVSLLEDIEPSEAELRCVIRRATIEQQLTPVLFASAFKNKGRAGSLGRNHNVLAEP